MSSTQLKKTTNPSEAADSSPKLAKALPAWMQVAGLSALAALGGAMIGLGWQQESRGWVGVFGISLFLMVQVRIRWWKAILHAYITGTTLFVVACPWLPSTVTYLAETDHSVSVAIAALYFSFQSLGLILFALIWGLLRRSGREAWLLTPLIWVGLEQLVPTLFPWPPAVLLTGDLPMLQLAEVGGVHLVSLLVVGLAAFFAWTLQSIWQFASQSSRSLSQRTLVIWGVLAAGLLGVRVWGSTRLSELDSLLDRLPASGLRVGLVQADTGFDDSNKRMIEVTRALEGQIDLAVWPEDSLGNYDREITDFKDAELVARRSLGLDTKFVPFPNPHCVLLAGGDTWEGEKENGAPEHQYVSALLIDEQEKLIGRRDKYRLMPYGEYIPGESVLPFLRKMLGDERVISAGTSTAPIGVVNDFRIGVLICCEDMHPDLVRNVVLNGVDCLVTLGNGMVFDSEIALRQHFRIARIRAIEHRLFHLRCTSTGVSGLIAPSGQVKVELPAMRDTAAVIVIPKVSGNLGPSLYTRSGWLVVWIISLAVVLLYFLSCPVTASGPPT